MMTAMVRTLVAALALSLVACSGAVASEESSTRDAAPAPLERGDDASVPTSDAAGPSTDAAPDAMDAGHSPDADASTDPCAITHPTMQVACFGSASAPGRAYVAACDRLPDAGCTELTDPQGVNPSIWCCAE